MTISYGEVSKSRKLLNNPHELKTQIETTDVQLEKKLIGHTDLRDLILMLCETLSIVWEIITIMNGISRLTTVLK